MSIPGRKVFWLSDCFVNFRWNIIVKFCSDYWWLSDTNINFLSKWRHDAQLMQDYDVYWDDSDSQSEDSIQFNWPITGQDFAFISLKASLATMEPLIMVLFRDQQINIFCRSEMEGGFVWWIFHIIKWGIHESSIIGLNLVVCI